MSIRVGTFNVGQGYGDYSYMCSADELQRNNLLATVGDGGVDAQQAVQKKGEEQAAERIASQVDVLCLQELMKTDRPFAQKLGDLGFTIVLLDEAPSTAVAYRTNKFTSATPAHLKTDNGCGIYGEGVAVVNLTLQSGKSLAIASLHSHGFQLYGPQQKRPDEESNHDRTRHAQADAYNGAARQCVAGLSSDYAIMAGDMNNNPENYAPTFDQYRRDGYRLMRSGKDTNVNVVELSYSPREIDFMFAPEQSLMQRLINTVKPFFVNVKELHVDKPTIATGFAFEHDKNCSDHLPLVTTVTEVDVEGSKVAAAALAIFVMLAVVGTVRVTRLASNLMKGA